MIFDEKYCWYAAGLHFECLQCGRCCAGPEQGYIWVTGPEILLMANHLGISIKEVKQNFLKRVGLQMSISENPHTRDCVFLRQTEHGRGCAIYEVRPTQCRNWPFWTNNLISSELWNLTTRQCPGVNRGRLYCKEEIENKAKNKKWWRNEPK